MAVSDAAFGGDVSRGVFCWCVVMMGVWQLLKQDLARFQLGLPIGDDAEDGRGVGEEEEGEWEGGKGGTDGGRSDVAVTGADDSAEDEQGMSRDTCSN